MQPQQRTHEQTTFRRQSSSEGGQNAVRSIGVVPNNELAHPRRQVVLFTSVSLADHRRTFVRRGAYASRVAVRFILALFD